MAEIDYKKLCEQYEQILGIGEYDPVKNSFFVLIKMLNQQTKFLDSFDILEHIGNADKDSPKYKRAMDMMDGLPKMIGSVNELRATLKLSKEDLALLQRDKTYYSKITTPESIADVLGNTAGQNS